MKLADELFNQNIRQAFDQLKAYMCLTESETS